MTAAVYPMRSELPWSTSLGEERRFRRLCVVALILFLVLTIVIPNLNVPTPPRQESEALPPRLAKLLVEKPAPPPPPPPPKVEEKEPELPKPEKKEESKPEVKPEPTPEAPVDRVAVARERASKSGLLALQNELADLRDNSLVDNVTKNTNLSRGGAQTTQRSLLTSSATRASGGIDSAQLSRDAGNTKLAGRTTTAVNSELADREAKGGKKARSRESIDVVLDRVKGALKSIYQRELRTDPSLQGVVVFELKIDPSGSPQVRVISSALPDEVARKLAARIKSFDFGAQNVEPIALTWDVDFQPDM